MASPSGSLQFASKLNALSAQSSREPEVYRDIELNAQSLANDLRVRDGESQINNFFARLA